MNQESKHDIKEKIRQRYRGGDVENMHMIPARAKEFLFEENTEKKVCAYCRVSTDDPRQTSSYELQKNHYLWRNQHDPIVSPEAWRAAQTILNICKNGGSGSLPALRVIREGALQGFVSVNRHQTWEDSDTFVRASLSVYGEEFTEEDAPDDDAPSNEGLPSGGYQVVRAGFFQDHIVTPRGSPSRGFA